MRKRAAQADAALSFEVKLLIDNREVKNANERDFIVTKLTARKVNCEVRPLQLGDFLWIAVMKESGEELVLDHIVERKKLDDFCSSIIDGRYKEQKFRLAHSGLDHPVYLVEGDAKKVKRTYSSIGMDTLESAMASIHVQDGFVVRQTDNMEQTLDYLELLTLQLRHSYAKNASRLSTAPTMQQFAVRSSKSKNLTVNDIFAKQLLQVRGCSPERALAIVMRYSTPMALYSAYAERKLEGANESELQALFAVWIEPHSGRRFGPVFSRELYTHFYAGSEL